MKFCISQKVKMIHSINWCNENNELIFIAKNSIGIILSYYSTLTVNIVLFDNVIVKVNDSFLKEFEDEK